MAAQNIFIIIFHIKLDHSPIPHFGNLNINIFQESVASRKSNFGSQEKIGFKTLPIKGCTLFLADWKYSSVNLGFSKFISISWMLLSGTLLIIFFLNSLLFK
jgi:hypothetical protein